MDSKVKDAQVWVNSTYKDVSGYRPCPENGLVGWLTTYSLIMGLQHELNITPVVASFGPTTVARMNALGDIGFGWKENANIVQIIQHGLFCKGYWGADIYGQFGQSTSTAVMVLRTHMGLPDTGSNASNGIVDTQILRCILNMDAYVMVAGGSEKVREIQRWLNGRYASRNNFTIGPCDGIYSRDVQKSFMIALQYEMGIDAPNGNFGQATQDGLRNLRLNIDASGIFVELFSAACVFNEPLFFNDQIVVTSQRSIYDQKLAEYVTLFQSFTQIPETGIADYTTWAELLVSMGDPERKTAGCDTRFEITPSRARWLSGNGYEAVGRYIYDPPGSTIDKEIKKGELEVIFNAGLRVIPIYQDNNAELSDFTYAKGYQQALNAHQLASNYGFNRGTVIYFAVDYDATQVDTESSIIPYFQGVQSALNSKGKRYFHGVYGSRNVCINVTEQTFARYSFVSGMSWGFSGNLGFPLPSNWSFNQIKEFTVSDGADSFDLDNNVWRRDGGDPGQSSVNATTSNFDVFLKYLQRLYDCAVSYGKGDPNTLVMDYLRSQTYNDARWRVLVGPSDSAFGDYANGLGFTVMQEFEDPFTGYPLSVPHIMACALGETVTPQPTDPASVNQGDIAGWGGDLLSIYREWRDASDSYSSGYTFCMERLAVPGVATSFGFTDLIEDADGYLISRRVGAGADIVTVVGDHYTSGTGLNRFSDFLERRFTDAANCKSLTHGILTALDNDIVVLARAYIVGSHAWPGTLPGSKLSEFEDGFVAALLNRVEMEARMASTYKRNQSQYLQEAQSR